MLTNIQIGNWDYLGAYYRKEDENLYLVNSVYEQYGIKNLAKILAKDSEVKVVSLTLVQLGCHST